MNSSFNILFYNFGGEALASQNITTCQDIRTFGGTRSGGCQGLAFLEVPLPKNRWNF